MRSNGHFSERLRQQRVVCVAARRHRDRPRLFPRQAVVIDEQPHQLSDRERRMRVVHLDGHLRREFVESTVLLAVALHDVAHGAGHEEVLLQQSQLATAIDQVGGVEDLRDRFGVDLVLHRGDVVAGVEDADVEFVGGPRAEEAKDIHRLAAVADDRHVVRHADDDFEVDPRRLVHAADGGVGNRAIHGDDDGITVAVDQPRRTVVVEPVIRLLVLVAVDEGLAEETEFVVDAVAEAGHVQRGKRIEEAGRQPPETTVAEGGIVLE